MKRILVASLSAAAATLTIFFSVVLSVGVMAHTGDSHPGIEAISTA